MLIHLFEKYVLIIFRISGVPKEYKLGKCSITHYMLLCGTALEVLERGDLCVSGRERKSVYGLNMVESGMKCIKYLVFVFNLIFFVSIMYLLLFF